MGSKTRMALSLKTHIKPLVRHIEELCERKQRVSELIETALHYQQQYNERQVPIED